MLINRRIFSSTKIMGLVGRNIDYSLSPVIHNAASLELYKDYVYLNLDLSSNHLEEFLKTMWDLGAFGFNITSPFKEAAASLLTNELISVNTLYRGVNNWCATSTDYIGFKRALDLHCKSIADYKKIIFLGFGGASKALLEGLNKSKELKGKSIEIYNRTPCPRSSFEKLGLGPDCSKNFYDFAKVATNDSIQNSLLVQALPNTAITTLDGQMIKVLETYPGTIFDLNYTKLHTYFFKRLNHNLEAIDGLSMLIHQALEAQKIWWGQSISYDKAMDAIKDSGLLDRS